MNNRVTKTEFNTWKTDVFNPLSVTVTNLGKKVDTNTANINKLLGWFNVDADGNLFTTLNFYSTKEISANGISQGTSGEGNSNITAVLDKRFLGKELADDNSVVFNAYATNEIYKTTQGHASRIGVLESQVGQLTTQGTKVSVSDLLTTGTKIATITVDGVPHEVKGDFLPTSGGTLTGRLTIKGSSWASQLVINGVGTQSGINFQEDGGSLGLLHVNGLKQLRWYVDAKNYEVLHSGNIGEYALPLTGGRMKDAATIQWGNNICSWDNVAKGFIGISNNIEEESFGYYAGLSFKGYYGLQFRTFGGRSSNLQFRGFNAVNWGDWKTIAFTDSTVEAAKKLVTDNGGGLVYFASNTLFVGDTIYPNYQTHILGYDVVLRSGASATQGLILNSHGNVTIGSSDLASTTTKLYVDGGIRFAPRTIWGQSFDGTGNIGGSIGLALSLEFTGIPSTAGHGGFIDFHYNGSSADYTSRIIESNNGLLAINGELYVKYGGNVGIGTLAPEYKLDVNGDVGISSTNGSIEIDNGRVIGNATLTMQAIGTTHARIQTSHFGVAYTCPLYINPSGGNVLIGTTTDSGYKLDVRGDSYVSGFCKTSKAFITSGNYGVWLGSVFSGNLIGDDVAYNAAKHIFWGGNVGIYTMTPQYALDINGTLRATNAATFGSTLTIAGATTHNGIAYFGGTTYYINTSGNANFNAISGRSLQVDSAAFNGTIHSNEYSGSVAKWSITKDGAASFASLSNGGLLETSTLRVSSTSTFTGKTNHNGGIGATSLNVSGTSTLSGHVGIGTSPHSTYALYVDGSLRCGPIDGGTASLGALYSNTHVPNSSETYDLGSDYYRWASIYGVGADFSGNVTVGGSLYADDIRNSGSIYITTTYTGANLYLHPNGYVGADNGRWAIDGYGNYKGQSLYINPRDNDNYTNPYDKNKGFPDEEVAVFVNGDIAATGEISANALNQGSDIRFKHQLGDITLDLDTIANAPMFRFTWTNKENSRVQIGTSAQYWKDSARELVSVDKDDFHRLDYATLGVLIGVTLGKTVKNHEDRIKELEREVVELKEENRRLRYEC